MIGKLRQKLAQTLGPIIVVLTLGLVRVDTTGTTHTVIDDPASIEVVDDQTEAASRTTAGARATPLAAARADAQDAHASHDRVATDDDAAKRRTAKRPTPSAQ